MRKMLVLVIEDDKTCLDLVCSALSEDGHTVRTAASLREARAELAGTSPDLIIMDRGLPDGDSLALCIELKRDACFRETPLMMLTGKAKPVEKVLGLRYGADDYLGKPFAVAELLARVDALARRAGFGTGTDGGMLVCGDIRMDLRGRLVETASGPVDITPTEFELLRALLERQGEALSREFLLNLVWRDSSTGGKVVDVTIMNLRRKLGAGGAFITAVRGLGYKLVPQAVQE
ncbi:MAG: response regulator transcription factor [Elusimicrobiales bacterium]|nr:response regulator transcription factor [Elusimicrobiales bacterium]